MYKHIMLNVNIKNIINLLPKQLWYPPLEGLMDNCPMSLIMYVSLKKPRIKNNSFNLLNY